MHLLHLIGSCDHRKEQDDERLDAAFFRLFDRAHRVSIDCAREICDRIWKSPELVKFVAMGG